MASLGRREVPRNGRFGEQVRRRADGVEDVTVTRAHAIDNAPTGAAPDDLWTLHHRVGGAGEGNQRADRRAPRPSVTARENRRDEWGQEWPRKRQPTLVQPRRQAHMLYHGIVSTYFRVDVDHVVIDAGYNVVANGEAVHHGADERAKPSRRDGRGDPESGGDPIDTRKNISFDVTIVEGTWGAGRGDDVPGNLAAVDHPKRKGAGANRASLRPLRVAVYCEPLP